MMKLLIFILVLFSASLARAESTEDPGSVEHMMKLWKAGSTGFCSEAGSYHPAEIEKFKSAVFLLGFKTEFTNENGGGGFCLFIICPSAETTPYRLANETEMWKIYDRVPSMENGPKCHPSLQTK